MEKNKVYQVLDKGQIQIIDWLGSELTIVNSAKVSFGKRSQQFSDKDKRLLKYLADNNHGSPWRQVFIQMRIKWPQAVARQAIRHLVGVEGTSYYPTKDLAMNQVSGRYTEYTEYYEPSIWRCQSKNNKQASDGALSDQNEACAKDIFNNAMCSVYQGYNKLLQLGVAREQARLILPFNIYTQICWTISFQALMNFIQLRNHEHAQWQIREYAKVMQKISYELFPVATQTWLNRKKG